LVFLFFISSQESDVKRVAGSLGFTDCHQKVDFISEKEV